MAVQFEQEILDGQRAWTYSQAAFEGGTVRELTEAATLGWYGTRTHVLEGAFGVVRPGLEDLVGEVVRFTYQRRAAVIYLLAVRDIPQDIAVTRRAWMALAPLYQAEIEPLMELVA